MKVFSLLTQIQKYAQLPMQQAGTVKAAMWAAGVEIAVERRFNVIQYLPIWMKHMEKEERKEGRLNAKGHLAFRVISPCCWRLCRWNFQLYFYPDYFSRMGSKWPLHYQYFNIGCSTELIINDGGCSVTKAPHTVY